jgi:hypothetical protein
MEAIAGWTSRSKDAEKLFPAPVTKLVRLLREKKVNPDAAMKMAEEALR